MRKRKHVFDFPIVRRSFRGDLSIVPTEKIEFARQLLYVVGLHNGDYGDAFDHIERTIVFAKAGLGELHRRMFNWEEIVVELVYAGALDELAEERASMMRDHFRDIADGLFNTTLSIWTIRGKPIGPLGRIILRSDAEAAAKRIMANRHPTHTSVFETELRSLVDGRRRR